MDGREWERGLTLLGIVLVVGGALIGAAIVGLIFGIGALLS